jgi:hypothetical protein
MILSKVETCASRAASAAARSLLTFSCGVSPAGPSFLWGGAFEFVVDDGTFAEACGVVEVNRVASVADRGIAADSDTSAVGMLEEEDCLLLVIISAS